MCQKSESELVEMGRRMDALRWVAQEARAAVMLGYVGKNHEKLRDALKMLDQVYRE